jgi:hypothetical protein
MTHYIRFPDESTGMAALDAAGLTTTNEDGDTVVLTASHTHALDVIGPISKGGTYDPDTGEVITPPVLLSGWHVNYVGELPEGWAEYAVSPEQPARVWL